ncbi:hypothetical protein [Campylobacter estrildidarum]|uniref:Uncharacterized protein n=1 Tax=Campylobacter estrildidarum TaxID=2510189 RepID=A0A4U7BBG4_9BACT|nr:hypothetical protein [Campylobacter estrildidarum]TKX28239.1 hypothetical protein CQA69_08445 [Campylobacter estrildidarum]
MFLKNKKNEKIKSLEEELARLKKLINLKDAVINEIGQRLEDEIKSNIKLSHFRIKTLEALGLIGVRENDEIALEKIKILIALNDANS